MAAITPLCKSGHPDPPAGPVRVRVPPPGKTHRSAKAKRLFVFVMVVLGILNAPRRTDTRGAVSHGSYQRQKLTGTDARIAKLVDNLRRAFHSLPHLYEERWSWRLELWCSVDFFARQHELL